MRPYSHKTQDGSFIRSPYQVICMRIKAIQRIKTLMDESVGTGRDSLLVTFDVMKARFLEDFGFPYDQLSTL